MFGYVRTDTPYLYIKDEELYRRALEVVRLTRRASTSPLQRRMGIGYNHAARLIDMLEERGIIGQAKGAGPRDILVDLDSMVDAAPDAATEVPAEAATEESAEAGEENVDLFSNPEET